MKAYIPEDAGPGWWRDIPGYDGKYQVNRIADVRRVFPSGLVRDMTAYRKSGRKFRQRLFVKLTKDGKSTEVPLLTIMAMAWYGTWPESKVPYHINRNIWDNRLENIGFIDRVSLGRLTGHMSSKRKTVFKVDRDGRDVEVYRSAREAAKANHMSYQTVLDRCNGKVKNPYALDGFTYRFEDAKPGRQKG